MKKMKKKAKAGKPGCLIPGFDPLGLDEEVYDPEAEHRSRMAEHLDLLRRRGILVYRNGSSTDVCNGGNPPQNWRGETGADR